MKAGNKPIGWLGSLRSLWRIYRDPAVSGWAKALFLVIAGLYLVCPMDLMPEIIVGPLGMVDDAIIVPLILSLIRWIIPKEQTQAADGAAGPGPSPRERKRVKSRKVR
jgi:uncharacterized membrane protein YkvA (DUF1232 family)